MPPPEAEQRSLLKGRRQQHASSFGVTPEDLAPLFDPKNKELLEQLGGTQALAKKLRVDPSVGLSSDEGVERSADTPFEERQAVFGRNVLPEAKSKSFLELLWAAYNDKTLSMNLSPGLRNLCQTHSQVK